MMATRTDTGKLHRLAAAAIGEERAKEAIAMLAIDPVFMQDRPEVTRADAAMALNVALFADLLERVPTARKYADGEHEKGEAIVFDHGALRTIDGESGEVPIGHTAFARILGPLGYDVAGEYPLPRLNMTGRAYAHRDMPETIPQFFVSELHVANLPSEAQDAANRIFATSSDPLGHDEQEGLDFLARNGACPVQLAEKMMPGLLAAFGRQHEIPALADYEALLPHSREGAWIATEGNAFNHATTRVPDVDRLAGELRASGMPMKPEVEVSANGRVRQTAFIADKVEREFRDADGGIVTRMVPGSFYEFITRDEIPDTGKLDLTFDSGNATGIFSVTSTR